MIFEQEQKGIHKINEKVIFLQSIFTVVFEKFTEIALIMDDTPFVETLLVLADFLVI